MRFRKVDTVMLCCCLKTGLVTESFFVYSQGKPYWETKMTLGGGSKNKLSWLCICTDPNACGLREDGTMSAEQASIQHVQYVLHCCLQLESQMHTKCVQEGALLAPSKATGSPKYLPR
jgi:hypothetical protein